MVDQPLLPLNDILRIAAARRCCIPAFDVGGGRPEFIHAVLDVCREHDSPAVFICWVGAAKRFGLRAIVALVRALAEEANVPASLQLDHASDEADVRSAVEAGFPSVMFDRSSASFQENVERTQGVAEYAHGASVSIEAAFGAMGREGSGGRDHELTDPALAARFVRETGVDILTPSVGNVHGCRDRTVPLNWELIEELSSKVSVPMALHGGSGIAIEDVRRAAMFGFRKINVATKLHLAYSDAVRAYVRDNPEDGWFRWTAAGREAVRKVTEQYITGLSLQGLAEDLREQL